MSDYAHSTAPNRRYPDLVTQRLVKSALATDPPAYAFEALVEIARHCTRQEDNANRVERQVLKAAAGWLMQDRIGGRSPPSSPARPKGTFVRTPRPLPDGRLVRGFEGADVGHAVHVRLLAVDPKRGFIDFEHV